jgi:SET domain-containing protein
MATQKVYRPAKVKVKRSKAGLGLYASQEIKKGQFIIEYKGPILNDKQVLEKGGKYLFEIGKNKTIDGTNRLNVARYFL